MSSAVPRFYKRPPPTSPDAYRIWIDCCLGDVMEVTAIYWALDSWARLNCLIFMKEERPYVFWTSPTGVRHECYADTFAHWVLCACEEVTSALQPPQLQQPPTPNGEFQPAFPLDPIAEEEEEQTNEIIFHFVEKIGDEADKLLEQTLKEELVSEPILTFEEVVHMNLEQFLNESTESESTESE